MQKEAEPRIGLNLGFTKKSKSIQETQPMTRFSSIFSQLLQLFPRLEFEQAVKEHHAERSAKGFSSWGQFVAMLDRKSTRLNSSHEWISYAVFCLKKKKHT